MTENLRLMCILAHPDDESLGNGGTLAKYAAEGVSTHLITATRGERGWTGDPATYPGPATLGQIREDELRAAARVLGIQTVDFLDYMDGELDQADPAEVTAKVVTHIRQVRPHVVVTFGPDGAYGHPDHIAISQITTSAVVCAADPAYAAANGSTPHRVSKLYYMVAPESLLHLYEDIFGELVMHIDGVERRFVGWNEWAITTRLDVAAHWRTTWRAVLCHRTQIPPDGELAKLPDEQLVTLWGRQWYYRAFSLVNGGRTPETDLFEGLRQEQR
jgi:LmbE family N-acetylglucosaminyl deacetylase